MLRVKQRMQQHDGRYQQKVTMHVQSVPLRRKHKLVIWVIVLVQHKISNIMIDVCSSTNSVLPQCLMLL